MNDRWKVIVRGKISNRFKRLPEKEQARIKKVINRFIEDPRSVQIKALKARPEWSLRIGRWRVLLRIDYNKNIIFITDFGPRGDVYKK